MDIRVVITDRLKAGVPPDRILHELELGACRMEHSIGTAIQVARIVGQVEQDIKQRQVLERLIR